MYFAFRDEPSENDIREEFLSTFFAELKALAEKKTRKYCSVALTLEEMCTNLVKNLMKLTEDES